MSKVSKARKQSTKVVDREFEQHIEAYVLATGDIRWTVPKVSAWIIETNRCNIRRETLQRMIARRLRKVAGRAKFFDHEKGRWIRKYHPQQLGEQQPMLYSTMEEIGGPEQMKESVKVRRTNIASRVCQGVDDVDYYNRNLNPGDPIVFETDFTHDVEDRVHPTLYNDVPPEEDDTDLDDSPSA